jgi:hypothetical protein
LRSRRLLRWAKREEQHKENKCLQAAAHEKLPSNQSRGHKLGTQTSFTQPAHSYKDWCKLAGEYLREPARYEHEDHSGSGNISGPVRG